MFYADYWDDGYWDVEYWDSEFPNPSWSEGASLAGGFTSDGAAVAAWTESDGVEATWNYD